MAPTHRCLCTSHKCNDFVDATGERGVLVNIRTYRQHEQHDKNAAMSVAVTEAQKRILGEQDAKLAKVFSGVSIVDPTPILPTMNASLRSEYRINRTRKMVEHVSKIKDSCSQLQDEAESIGFAPSDELDPKIVQVSLRHLEFLQTSAAELEGRLSTIACRSKEPPVVALRDVTMVDLGRLSAMIKGFEQSWRKVFLKINAQREAELAKGAIEYNSGLSSYILELQQATNQAYQTSISNPFLTTPSPSCSW